MKRLSGYCLRGHPLEKQGYIEGGVKIRCRTCRKIDQEERDYWALVHRYIDSGETDQEALAILKRDHWVNP